MGNFTQSLWLATCTVAICFTGTSLSASIRYELTEFLGEHPFNGEQLQFLNTAYQQIDTPLYWHEIKEARIVVEGRVVAGRARGDGIVLENDEFDLLPSVSIAFGARGFFDLVSVTPEVFRIESSIPDPFVPEVTPLPNPDGYPPVSFSVGLGVGPAIPLNLPPRIDPSQLYLGGGYIVDVPIVATIDQAYVILSGPNIVPEPSGVAIAVGLLLVAGAGIRIRELL